MTELHKINVHLSEGQKRKIAKAYRDAKAYSALSGSDTLMVPMNTIKKLSSFQVPNKDLFRLAMMSDLLNKGQIRDLAKAHQNGSDMLSLIKFEAWLIYFLYTKSIHFLHLTALVYIFSIHQIYIKQNFVL